MMRMSFAIQERMAAASTRESVRKRSCKNFDAIQFNIGGLGSKNAGDGGAMSLVIPVVVVEGN